MPAGNSNGHSALVIPTSTSEYHTMITAMRAHHRGMHGQVTDIAAFLRNVLPDVIRERGGSRIGIDARMKALRVIRPLMDVGALNDHIARLYVISYQRYTDLVVNAKDAKPKSGFNADN